MPGVIQSTLCSDIWKYMNTLQLFSGSSAFFSFLYPCQNFLTDNCGKGASYGFYCHPPDKTGMDVSFEIRSGCFGAHATNNVCLYFMLFIWVETTQNAFFLNFLFLLFSIDARRTNEGYKVRTLVEMRSKKCRKSWTIAVIWIITYDNEINNTHSCMYMVNIMVVRKKNKRKYCEIM